MGVEIRLHHLSGMSLVNTMIGVANLLIYGEVIDTELQKHEHWLLQLQWLFFKMEKKNFVALSEKLNYDPVQLTQAFRVICRIPQL